MRSGEEAIHSRDVLIIGGGLTGLGAAMQVSRAGLDAARLKVTCIIFPRESRFFHGGKESAVGPEKSPAYPLPM